MAFSYQNRKGITYVLHGHVTKLRNDREQQISFFSKMPGAGLDQLSAGWEVVETKTSGLPVLKKTTTG